MDPSNGAVKAWVGGLNHKYFKYDHVRQARQPGWCSSRWCTALYLEAGYAPCQKVFDISPSIKLPDGRMWRPKNSDGSYGSGEELTLRKGLASVGEFCFRTADPEGGSTECRRLCA